MSTVPYVANIKRRGGGGEKREGEPLVARFLSLLIPVTSGPRTKWTILIARSRALIQ